MATLRDYFESDCARVAECTYFVDAIVKDADGNQIGSTITRSLHLAFDQGSKFWSMYFPGDVPLADVKKCLWGKEILNAELIDQAPNASIGIETAYSGKISFHDLTFTKRVFLYIDSDLSNEQKASIRDESQARGLEVVIRDADDARTKSKDEKPLAFIIHDSRDKDEIVINLVRNLSRSGVPAWYDEYSLKVGDNIRERIEQGLKEAKYCVLILSPHFLSNKGWGVTEYDSVFTRERLEKRNIFLPIWHNVSKEDVYEYSPSLANKFALSSSLGSQGLASRLARRILDDET